MLYKQIIKFFSRDTAFQLMMLYLSLIGRLPFLVRLSSLISRRHTEYEISMFGMKFRSPLGLGAGVDKNGALVSALAVRDYGFITVGPVNGESVRNAIPNLKKRSPQSKVCLCVNGDYSTAIFLAYDFVDAFLLEIQDSEILETLGQVLDLRLTYDSYKPFLLRISRDYPDAMLNEILDFSLRNGVDGFEVAKEGNVRKVAGFTKGRVPIIGYGGIRSVSDAAKMFNAGATALSITTGIILDGPGVARRMLKKMRRANEKQANANERQANPNEKQAVTE